ncbi:MAG: enoyl-CoA hydratase/isomerase family protein [Xanthomonadales bacterium]|nr:enoyl-CoA hydratase/isomerase family protein [Xanthomonadales bacterium]
MLEIIDHGSTREIRMARPPVNALNPEFVGLQFAALNDAVKQADAVVLSGLPGILSAGLDVVELLPLGRTDMLAFWYDFIGLMEAIACAPVPVAVAITGHAPAGGALLSLMADYRVMSRGAYRIGLNETRVGLVLPPLLQQAMARVVGPRIAEKLIVPGTLISPQQALEIQLVDALQDGYEDTVGHAVQWCEELLALPRDTMLANREIARTDLKQAFSTITGVAADALTNSWFSDETQVVLHDFVTKLKNKG